MEKTKHVVIIAPPETILLDVSGPLEVFTQASAFISKKENGNGSPYVTHVVSTQTSNVVVTSSGLPIVCEGGLESVDYEVDTVLVAGIPRASENMVSIETLDWLKQQSAKVRRMGSICAGAFILAEAGVLDGRRATTHWAICERMAKRYPKVKVDPEPIFVKDKAVYTSAGISTGMDLALAMVEEDYGRAVALSVARQLVLYLKRPGNQSQYSAVLTHQEVDYQPINDLQDWILEHLHEPLSVAVLAEKASMSPRNFARVFLRETGVTPAKYIEKIRLERARQRLEESLLTLNEIALECGLGDVNALRRLFLRHLGITPSDYRRSFGGESDTE